MSQAGVFSQSYFHGTKADLRPGDFIEVGRASNFATDRPLSWVYFSSTLDAAIWGAELATGGERQRIYVVEPTGPVFDDPNLTDTKFPGNPTQSYRSQKPIEVVGEVERWEGHPPDMLQKMKDSVERMRREGIQAID